MTPWLVLSHDVEFIFESFESQKHLLKKWTTNGYSHVPYFKKFLHYLEDWVLNPEPF